MSWLIHLANVLILVSFLARDILWLRTLSILAGLTFIRFYLGMDEPLWEAVGWNVVFIAINAVQIVRLVVERSPVRLSEAEARLHQLLFLSLRPRDVRRLIGCGAWRDVSPGEVFVRQGEKLDQLYVLAGGRVGVDVDGQRVAELAPGRLIGELSWVTGGAATADVVALDSVRCVAWDHGALKTFLEHHPAVRQALQVIVGQDLAKKLRR